MSLGKIRDVLQRDHNNFFVEEEEFDTDIYDEGVSFEIGGGFLEAGHVKLNGKQKYINRLQNLRRWSRRFLENGTMMCTIDRADFAGDFSLRVKWKIEGTMNVFFYKGPIHLHAESFYALAQQVPCEDGSGLSHRIVRHKIEIKELHPPSLRDMIYEGWCWNRFQWKEGYAMAYDGMPLQPL